MNIKINRSDERYQKIAACLVEGLVPSPYELADIMFESVLAETEKQTDKFKVRGIYFEQPRFAVGLAKKKKDTTMYLSLAVVVGRNTIIIDGHYTIKTDLQ